MPVSSVCYFRDHKITRRTIDRDIQISKFGMQNTLLDTHCVLEFKVPAEISIDFLEELVSIFFKG